MPTWKKGSKVKKLIDLTDALEAAKRKREEFLNANAGEILMEIEEGRKENWRESEEFLKRVGKETGLFTTSRHARRCLYVVRALEENYLDNGELKEALDTGASLSAIGQLMEGETPKKAEFRRWISQLHKRGMTTKLRKSRGK